jgi:Zn-finger nucleic acid-binding protein
MAIVTSLTRWTKSGAAPSEVMAMTCPRCSTPLKPDKHNTGIAWRCTGCGGQSLNFSQFRRIVPEAHANGIWETAMLEPRAPRLRSLCPECRRDMAAVLIPVQERELELEVCRGCQRLWLDRQERIAGHLTENAEPGPLPEVKPISMDARIRMGEEMLRQMRRRQLIGRYGLWTAILILIALFVLGAAGKRKRIKWNLERP